MAGMGMPCGYVLLALTALFTSRATWCAAATVTYRTGPFSVAFQPDALPTLRVLRDGTSRPIWYTPSSPLPFVSVAKQQQQITQDGGNFVFKFTTVDQCNSLEIVRNGTRGSRNPEYPEVYFVGSLCNTLYFELSFQAEDVPDDYRAKPWTHLRFNLSLLNSSDYNQLRLTYGSEADEHFYGFGAQYSKFDMKGQNLPLFLAEQGVGRGLQPLTAILDLLAPGAGGTWYTTYTRVPHYITSHMRSLALESLEYTEFDMTLDDSVSIRVNSSSMTGRIITGGSPLEIISSYTAFAGRMAALPAWVGRGAVLGLEGGTGAVLRTIEQVEKVWGNLSDVTAVWLQDWTGERNFTGVKDLPRTGLWWNWEVDSAHYPNWTSLISTLNAKGIKTLTYINCMLSDVSKRGTPYTHNYFQEALDNGFAVKAGDGSVWTGYSNSTMVDLSNPQAYKWMVDIIVKNMLATGVCGWMCDFGESVPLNAKLTAGHKPQQFHSLYPSIWGQLNRDAIGNASQLLGSKLGSTCSPEEVVYFMRSGNVHSPRVTPLFWLGDQLVTWDTDDGLATAIIGMLSEGLSGYSMTHSDIGGYTAIHKTVLLKYVRTKELFLRWSELAAFTMMFRSHLGTLPDENWQFNSDTESLIHFFNMTVVFQSWGFYREVLSQEAAQYGWPVARHMMLVFPNNSRVYTEDLRFQFMLGTQLLVAPVYKRGSATVEVFLPGNTTWVHTWTGNTHSGTNSWVPLPAPIGRPCVLYPQGSSVGTRFVSNLRQRRLL